MTRPMFKKRLREARLFKSMTITDLSQVSGMPEKFLEHLETGDWRPALVHVSTLAEALDVSADYLLGVRRPREVVDDTPMAGIGNRIRSARCTRAMTQQDLADAMKTSVQSISRFELAERKPSAVTIIGLAKHLNVTTDYLLGVAGAVIPSGPYHWRTGGLRAQDIRFIRLLIETMQSEN